MRKRRQGKFSLEALGAWPLMVRDVITSSSCTADPLLLKGFQCLVSGYVRVLSFWGEVEGRDSGSGCGGTSKFDLRLPQLHDLWLWSVVSERQLGVS